MEVASSAVGIASLGIQVCQGLLSYYNSWKANKADIVTACQSIDDLKETFELLETTLDREDLDAARAKRVEECLGSCVGGLNDLEKKLQKVHTHPAPNTLRERLHSDFQRLSYPFKESTLVKIREIVSELRHHLSLALQVLQLDLSATSHRSLAQIGADVKDTAVNVRDLLITQQADQFHKIVDWLSPSDPWINHASARRHHEPHTGLWFLQSDQYQRWKGGHTRHFWLYGKAGCGKTVLSSTVIEDLQLHYKGATNAALAVFYFSFSDSHKQSFESLLLSLVAQLGGKGLGRSMLQREYDKPNRSLPGPAVLEEILMSSISQYDEVSLTLDALDECPESEEARRNMLDGLERFSEKASNLRIFATSRELQDIHERMDLLGADAVPISTQPVDADIGRYVGNELSRDRRLCRLDEHLKTLIIKTFAKKADGM
jgi:ankyrin repeat domain-containing protein 50